MPTSGGKKKQLNSHFALKKLLIYKGSHSKDFFIWYDEMNALCAFHHLSDKAFTQYLPWVLEGMAHQWLALQPLDVQNSGQCALVELSVTYSHLTTTHLDKHIRSTKQGCDENSQDFWYWLQCEANWLLRTFSQGQLEGWWQVGLQAELGTFMMQHANQHFDEQLQ
jgi:hypothetical protein